jgi:hypothetical protein
MLKYSPQHYREKGSSFITTILLLLLIAVSVSFFTYNFRVIKTTGGFHVVEKSEPGFEIPYVDITAWGIKDLFAFYDITLEVIKAGYGSEIPQVAIFKHAVDQGVETVQEFDERYGVSQGVSDSYDWTVEQMRQMDREYEIQQKFDAVADEAKRIDEEYGVSDSVKEGLKQAEEAAKKLWGKTKEE